MYPLLLAQVNEAMVDFILARKLGPNIRPPETVAQGSILGTCEIEAINPN